MPALLTAEAFREAARAALLSGSSPLSEEVVDTPSSNAGLVVEAAATLGVLLSRQMQDGFQGLYLGTARGEALDLLVRDRYGLARQGASPGVGSVSLARPTAAAGIVAVPAGTQIKAGTVTLETLAALSFGVADLGPYAVDVQTTRGGADQAVLSTEPLDVLGITADPTITASLVSDLAGAADAEEDVTLAERARRYWINARRGTVGAVENGCRNTLGVYRATVSEVLDGDGEKAGYLEAFIADRQGVSNAALAARVQENLLEYRAGAVQVVIRSGSVVYAPIAFVVAFAAGVNTTEKVAEIKAATYARVNTSAPGGTLLRSSLFAVLDSISGIVVSDAAITEPAGDLVAEQEESIRTRLDLISVNGG